MTTIRARRLRLPPRAPSRGFALTTVASIWAPTVTTSDASSVEWQRVSDGQTYTVASGVAASIANSGTQSYALVSDAAKVTDVDMREQDLVGTIPAGIGRLVNVETVNLSDNAALTGAIPVQIGNLTALGDLRINNCNITGAIPAQIGNCVALFRLLLIDNALSGTIPDSMSGLPALTVLSLKDNAITGIDWEQIQTGLISIDLARNSIAGSDLDELVRALEIAQYGGDYDAVGAAIPESAGSVAIQDNAGPVNGDSARVITDLVDNYGWTGDYSGNGIVSGAAALSHVTHAIPFSEASGTISFNHGSDGSAGNAIATGVTMAGARDGGIAAGQLDGVTDFWQPQKGFVRYNSILLLRFRPDSSGGRIFDSFSNDGRFLIIDISGDNNYVFAVFSASGIGGGPTVTFAPGTYYTLVIAFGDTLGVYVDGVSVYSTAITYDDTLAETQDIHLGRRQSQSEGYWNGAYSAMVVSQGDGTTFASRLTDILALSQ